MTHEETAAVLALARRAYGDRFTVDEDVVALWSDLLGDITPRAAAAAMRAHIATSEYPPTISAIRTWAGKMAVGAPAWEQAWREAMHEVARVGRAGKPRFTHPAVHRAVEAIDWIALNDCSRDGLSTLRAQFRDAYESGRRAAEQEANVGSLEKHVQRLRLGGATPMGELATTVLKQIGAGEVPALPAGRRR